MGGPKAARATRAQGTALAAARGAIAQGLGLGKEAGDLCEVTVGQGRGLWPEVRGQIPLAGQMSGLGLEGGRREGSGVRCRACNLQAVVGPDARLPRTSPVILDVLTG